MGKEICHVSLADCQVIQNKWEKDLGIVNVDPTERSQRMKEEWQELEEALAIFDSDGTLESRRAAGFEAMDVLIIGMSVIESLGLSAEQLFLDKMEINYEKYSVREMDKLRANGADVEEGLCVLKERWNNRA